MKQRGQSGRAPAAREKPKAAPESAEAADPAKQSAEEKPKRARRVLPTFQASMLSDQDKGLEHLLRKFERIDDASLDGSRESLALLMRTYQGWVYDLFPADFGDMCWKMGDRKGVKNIVRDFIFDKKGFSRFIGNDGSLIHGRPASPSSSDDDGEAGRPPTQPPASATKDGFLSDGGDGADIEILDLFDYSQGQ
jgi:hypothetical protein